MYKMSFIWAQRGTDLIGEGFGDQFGKAVAMSSDGTVVAVGGPYNDDAGHDAGHVRVYQWNGSTWSQKGTDIDGTTINGGSLFGVKIALSGDGNVIAIASSAPTSFVKILRWDNYAWINDDSLIAYFTSHEREITCANLSKSGTVLAISTKPDSGFSHQQQLNIYRYESPNSWYNNNVISLTMPADVQSISMSESGSVIAVGLMSLSRIQVYDFNGSTYIKRAADIQYTSPTGSDDKYGYSISMSPDSSYLAIGAPDAVNGGAAFTGRVYIDYWNGSSWTNVGTLSAEAPYDNFGKSVALSVENSANGQPLTLIVGSPNNSSNDAGGQSAGTAHIYTYGGGSSWSLKGTAIDSLQTNDRLGESVAISNDGSVVLLGVPQYNAMTGDGVSNGRARVYKYATVPGAPTGVSATTGIAQATVSWTAPESDGGSVITSYTVTASPGGATATTSGTSATVTGLANGTAYTFTVVATNVVGAGAASAPSAAVTTHTVPGAPTGVIATEGNNQAFVSWTAPTSNGGSAITGYTVTASPGGATATTSGTSATVSGLANDTTYTFTVVATNVVGASTASTASNAVTPKVPIWTKVGADIVGEGLGDRFGQTVAMSSNGTVVAVGGPYNDGNGADTGHARVYAYNGSSWVQRGGDIDGLVLNDNAGMGLALSGNGIMLAVGAPGGNVIRTYSWNDTTNGWDRKSDITVGSPAVVGKAISLSEDGTKCAFAFKQTAGNCGFIVKTYDSVTGNWVDSAIHANISSSEITSIQISPNGKIVVASVAETGTIYRYTDFEDGNGYVSSGSISLPSSSGTLYGTSVSMSADGNIIAVGAPGINTNKGKVFIDAWSTTGFQEGIGSIEGEFASDTFGTSVSLSADGTKLAVGAPKSQANSTFSANAGSMYMYKRDGASSTWNLLSAAVDGTSVDDNLGQSVAISKSGNVVIAGVPQLTASSTGLARVYAYLPDAPTNVSATAGNGYATITWTPPAYAEGSIIDGYIVTASPGGATVTTSETSATVLGLTIGTAYTFTVKTANEVGQSEASVASNSVTPATVPRRPTAVSAVAANAQAIVSWSAPTASSFPTIPGNGGSAITSYTVTASPGGATVTTIGTSATVTGLSNGTAYTFTVIATNAIGNSAASVASSSVTPATTPDAPTISKVRIGTDNIRVTWSAPANTGGAALTGYRIVANRVDSNTDVSSNVAQGSTTATINGLVSGISYNLRLGAQNSVGIGSLASHNITVVPSTIASRNAALNASGLALLQAGTMTRAEFKTLLREQYRNVYVPYVASFSGVNAAALYDSVASGVNLANKNVKMAIVENGETLTIDTASLTTSDVLHIPGEPGDAFTLVDSSGIPYAITFDASGHMIMNGGAALLPGAQVTLDRTYTVVGRGSAGLTPATVPDAPTGVTATAGDAQVTVSWSAPASDGGSAITGYTVTNTTTGATYDVSGDVTTRTITGLTNGTAYTFTVTATNDVGSSAASASATATPVAPQAPAPPAPEGSSPVPCFFGNARVLTPSGYRRMDSLVAGDVVMTPEGSTAAIERVKVTQCAAGPATNPYVIPAGTFGATRRLLISPDHKVCLADGRRIEAKRLGLAQEDREGTLTYYNLELAGQADMVVGGVPVESLAPVRRVVVRFADFAAAMKARYGELTPAVLASVQRTCRFVGPDAVEVPMIRKNK